MFKQNLTNTCRTCLSQNALLNSIFSDKQLPDYQEITLCEMLLSFTSVSVVKNDGFPQDICYSCTETLHRAYSFKKLCEHSDVVLRGSVDDIVNGRIKVAQNKEVFSSNGEEVVPSNIFKDDDQISTAYEQEIHALEYNTSNEAGDNSSKDESESSTEREPKQSEKEKRKSYSCEECNEECLGLASYLKHMDNSHGKNFKCDCGRKFKSRTALMKHKSSQHQEEAKYKQLRSKNKSGIIRKRNLPRTCEICNKTFRFHSNLERHKLIHTGEKPYLCNVCGKGFGQMSYLKIHSFIHTGEKPYKCQMCDKSFAAPGTLMTHVRIHTGERPHVCKICGKDFPQSGYLSAHIRTHTGEKPVECKVCHRRFNQSGRLVIHMRIHSGEKPYTCSQCGRSFAVKGTLKKHIRTHTGERPYICSVCGQAFAQSGTLATHMKVHRPK